MATEGKGKEGFNCKIGLFTCDVVWTRDEKRLEQIANFGKKSSQIYHQKYRMLKTPWRHLWTVPKKSEVQKWTCIKKSTQGLRGDKANGEKLSENLFVRWWKGVKKSVCLSWCVFVWMFDTTISHQKCPENKKKQREKSSMASDEQWD